MATKKEDTQPFSSMRRIAVLRALLRDGDQEEPSDGIDGVDVGTDNGVRDSFILNERRLRNAGRNGSEPKKSSKGNAPQA